jgi:hypothetical protein
MKYFALLTLGCLPLVTAGCLDQSAAAAESAPRAGAQPVVEESLIRGFDPAAPDQSILALAPAGLRASKLTFEKTAIELGQIYQYDKVPFEFPFFVDGSDPVIVSRLESNCGCTDMQIRADWEMAAPGADPGVVKLYVLGTEIPAGAKATVIGVFTPENRKGDKSSIVTLHGNFANTPVKLDLHANIRALFAVTPPQVQFGDVLFGVEGSARPQEVKVVCREPFDIVNWKRLPPGVKVEPVGEAKPTGYLNEVERHFRVSLGADAPEGLLSSSCIAETSIKMNLEILVLGKVTGPVSYTPEARLAFGMVPANEERTRTVDLESSLPAVKLPAPTAELEGEALKYMKVNVATIEEGHFHRVRLTLPAQAEPLVLQGTLRLKYPAGSGIPDREFPITGRVVKSGPKEAQ